MSSFNIPLKPGENVPETFTIPSPKLREKIVISSPTTSDDFGRNFERMPSIYKGKHEEDLRDHILMVLDPNFLYGSGTGETFNKKGKTDILLRYDSSVVFVAECKFWEGEKTFL